MQSKKELLFAAFLVISPLVFFACDDGGGKDSKSSLLTFTTAANPGDAVPVKVGSETVNMVYANNLDSITFPYASDADTATLTRKFFVQQTEVTNVVFAAVMQWAYSKGYISETGTGNLLSDTTVMYGGQELYNLDVVDTYRKISYSTADHAFTVTGGYEDHPVIVVSWYGAVMFCNWLTEMIDGNTDNVVYAWTDNGDRGGTADDSIWQNGETDADDSNTGYRLPSREEWMYAARYIGATAPTAGDLAGEYLAQSRNSGSADLTAGYCWTPSYYASGATADYDNETATRAVAWYDGDSLMPADANKLMPVAQKSANQLGLYDLSGNAAEWIFTAFNETNRYDLGGSWGSPAAQMAICSYGYIDPNQTLTGIGIRVVKTR
ncbi:MAG TPA: SUMF1/EgtB/PvdO family nonheme iron enzyme [Spirochaetota bacterium]|nr:SUMF1/EgtB/PvdO family nonheme iron enzyme [Spirochaetota bacterium]